MEELTNILKSATASIENTYFYLSIDSGDSVYRERVYCYELYHRMRCLWPSNTTYYLNGEVDKAAHPILRELGADTKKPDLLIHKPGYMEGNHTVIEVKSEKSAVKASIKKDLNTLSLFVKKVKYDRAIYLLYGYNLDEKLTTIKSEANKIDDIARIEVWFHKRHNEPAECIHIIGK